jgi:class 3 adenylate cyclase
MPVRRRTPRRPRSSGTADKTGVQTFAPAPIALFGARIAHEDHAQRGVRRARDPYAPRSARQDLQRERALRFDVRQDLNTGLVVIGSIGSDLRRDYTAVGDTTNVTARLQQTADPGRIVISEGTHRLVSGYFHLRPFGPLGLKGKAETIGAWEVVAARQAPAPDGALRARPGRGGHLAAVADRRTVGFPGQS